MRLSKGIILPFRGQSVSNQQLDSKESNEHFTEAKHDHFSVKSKCKQFTVYVAKIRYAKNQDRAQDIYLRLFLVLVLFHL